MFADNVMVLGNNISIYTLSEDLYFFVTGSEGENDLILAEVLNKFYNAVDELPEYFLLFLPLSIFSY